MAIKALNGFGWFLTGVIVAPACYLVSSQVAAERSKVEAVERAIIQAHKDIRGLETEFDTRANLAQLERWNGEVMRYSAPTPTQFLASDRELAALRPMEGDGMANRYAAMVVPHDMPEVISGAYSASDAGGGATLGGPGRTSGQQIAAQQVAAQATAPTPRPAAARTTAEQPVVAKSAPAKVAGAKPAPAKSQVAKASVVKPASAKPDAGTRTGGQQLAVAKGAKPASSGAAPSRSADARRANTRLAGLTPIPVQVGQGRAADRAAVKPPVAKDRAVSALDRKLLKDSSFGDLMKDVRAEARGQR